MGSWKWNTKETTTPEVALYLYTAGDYKISVK